MSEKHPIHDLRIARTRVVRVELSRDLLIQFINEGISRHTLNNDKEVSSAFEVGTLTIKLVPSSEGDLPINGYVVDFKKVRDLVLEMTLSQNGYILRPEDKK